MQSNLKKSLYLGLAALSFASVASATNASSANAAKKHSHKRVAKKVTYKTTNRNLDQSVVFQSTGKNAVYSKPGTVKGAKVVATKTDMGSKANSNKSNDYFMAYQEATTSKGVHYYKVVSFDKKVRGYVYVGGVNKTQGSTDTSSKYNFKDTNVYLKANRLFNNAYGTVFGAKRINVDNANIGDNFSVDKAVTNRDGWTYFHVTDKNPSVGKLVSGWVNESNLTNNTKDALQNTANLVKVNFVNSDGNVVASSNLTPNPIKDKNNNVIGSGDYNWDTNTNSDNSDKTKNNSYSLDTMKNALSSVFSDATKSPLRGTGYNFDSNLNNDKASYYYNNMSALTGVTKGSTVTIKVNKDDASQQRQAKVNFKIVDKNNKEVGPINMVGAQTGSFDLNSSGLKGDGNTFFNLANVEGNIFNDGKPLNIIKTADGHTYKFNSNYTNTNQANGDFFNLYNSLKPNVLFNDVQSPINAYYSEVDNSQLIPSAGQSANGSDIVNGSSVANVTPTKKNIEIKSNFVKSINAQIKDNKIKDVKLDIENGTLQGNLGLHYVKNDKKVFKNLTHDTVIAKDGVKTYSDDKKDEQNLDGAQITADGQRYIRSMMNANGITSINLNGNNQVNVDANTTVNFD